MKNENDPESKISQNSQLFDNSKNDLTNKNLINDIIEEKIKIGKNKNKNISGASLPAINLSKLSSVINNKNHIFSKLKSF